MRHKTTVHFGGNTTLHWTHTHTHVPSTSRFIPKRENNDGLFIVF